ncbi:MAG TPA: CpsB/CapC family capsule biosynthesis tyrosine phosphatase [Candidatus Polarisedimenticolia bacterium]|nr:CpsB/CapC family capsule biosynthesis tyrosine phosphatase [Candidatus Polarisedimenticolia bacterium]
MPRGASPATDGSPLIDIHSHILPAIDDGSRSLEESVQLCRIAEEDGIRELVCTPHVDFRYTNRRSTIEGPFERLESAIRGAGLQLRLIKGAEVHMAPDIVVRLRDGDLVTYNDQGRYLLLEFPFQQVIMGVEDIVYRLRLAGVTPVIAHPERIGYFMDDTDRLFRLIRLGALGQVTGGSLLGQFGEKSQRAGMLMVERHLAHVVASDAHDTSYRRPVLSETAEAIAQRFGEDRARAMVLEYPAAIVAGEEINPPEPLEAPRRVKNFFLGLFSRRAGA